MRADGSSDYTGREPCPADAIAAARRPIFTPLQENDQATKVSRTRAGVQGRNGGGEPDPS